MLLVPYRAKNPPDSPPYCTIALIAINVLVFLCTTSGLQVTDRALTTLAVTANNVSVWRLITAMFLHADIFHIGFNMLFLWIFGAAVEGRLRHWRFLLIYFGAGLLGGWLSVLFYGHINPNEPGLGASGAIMGALGAYLYMFPFSQIRVFWWFFIRLGVGSVQAFWLIGFFVLKDLFENYLYKGADGTAHIAHLAGFGLGYAGAFAMRARIDSERSSAVKSTLAEVGDISLLSFRELEALLQHPTDNLALVVAYCRRCPAECENVCWPEKLTAMMRRHQALLIEQAEPLAVARMLLALPPDAPAPWPGVAYLRIGSRLEQARLIDDACLIYRRICELDPASRDAETALYRYARLLETAYADRDLAAEAYKRQIGLFPNGSLTLPARDALARLGFGPTEQKPRPRLRHTTVVISAPLPQRQSQLVPVNQGAPQLQAQPVSNGLEIGTGRKIEL